MRVLLTTHQFFPDFTSGTETLTLGVARELVARGMEVRILTGYPCRKSRSDVGFTDEYAFEGLVVYRFHHAFIVMPGQRSRTEGDFDNRLAAAYFRKIVADFKPDVVHCFHLHRLGTRIIEESIAAGIPTCFTPTDFWALCPTGQMMYADGDPCSGPSWNAGNCVVHLLANRAGPAYAGLVSWLPDVAGSLAVSIARSGLLPEKIGAGDLISVSSRKELIVSRLNLLDRIVVPTRMMERLLKQHGIDSSHMAFSTFGVASVETRPRRKGPAMAAGVHLGYIGTLAPHKGCHVLIQSFNMLSGSPANLSIYGRETDFPDYVKELRRLAKGNVRIRFCGEFPNARIGDVLANLDVLVVPSLWHENSPLIVYSAQAAHCPVIASDVEGIAEVVRDGIDGLLFQRGNLGDLAQTLSRVIGCPDLLEHLGSNALRPKTMAAYTTELLQIWSNPKTRHQFDVPTDKPRDPA